MKSISDLLSPITKEYFLENYYEKQVLIVSRNNSAYYRSILSVEQLDNYLANHDIQYPSLRMVKGGEEIDGKEYLKDVNYGTSQFKGLIENDKIFQLFSDGATIVIQGLDRSDFNLGVFTRGLSKEFPFTFQSNIYITPNDSYGFASHYDTHDVFVLQISGSKNWRIYDPKCVYLPTKNEKFNSKKTDLSGLEEKYNFDLQSGDLIYIPRGFVHRATTTSEYSIHITLGVFPEKWYDLIRYIGMESYILDDMKHTLPLNTEKGIYDVEAIKDKLIDKIKNLLTPERINSFLDKYTQKNIKQRKSSDYQRFSDLININKINNQIKFKLRPNIVYSLSSNEKYVEIRFYHKSIKLPSFALETIEDILNGKEFLISELNGDLDTDSKMILTKKLLKEGLIKIV